MTRSERAQQAWQVLVGCAANRQLSTYELLGERIGLPRFALAQVLGCVYFYCHRASLPHLTVLVVDKSGKPAEGFLTLSDPTKLDEYREQVFEYGWDRLLPPSAASLEVAFIAGMTAQQKAVPPDNAQGA